MDAGLDRRPLLAVTPCVATLLDPPPCRSAALAQCRGGSHAVARAPAAACRCPSRHELDLGHPPSTLPQPPAPARGTEMAPERERGVCLCAYVCVCGNTRGSYSSCITYDTRGSYSRSCHQVTRERERERERERGAPVVAGVREEGWQRRGRCGCMAACLPSCSLCWSRVRPCALVRARAMRVREEGGVVAGRWRRGGGRRRVRYSCRRRRSVPRRRGQCLQYGGRGDDCCGGRRGHAA